MKRNSKTANIWLSLAHFLNDIYTGFLNPLMPFLAAKIGFSLAIATAIISVSHIFSSLLQPIFGFFADNILKRAFIFWGLLFTSIFVPLVVLAPDVNVLTILIVLGSIGSSFFHPQAIGLVAKLSGNNYAKDMGIFISTGTIGFSLGPILAGVVVQHLGFEYLAYLAFVGCIWAVFMFKFVPKMSLGTSKVKNKSFKQAFKTILTNKSINILIFLSVMKSLIVNSSCILLPFLWHDQGYTPTNIGFILFLFVFVGGIASLCSKFFEDKFGAKAIFYFSMISTLPLMILFFFLYEIYPILSIIIFILMGFISMLATPVIMVMAQKIMPEYKSIIAGFINGFSWGIAALNLSIVGFFAQKLGIVNVLLGVSFIPALFSVFIKYLPNKYYENS